MPNYGYPVPGAAPSMEAVHDRLYLGREVLDAVLEPVAAALGQRLTAQETQLTGVRRRLSRALNDRNRRARQALAPVLDAIQTRVASGVAETGVRLAPLVIPPYGMPPPGPTVPTPSQTPEADPSVCVVPGGQCYPMPASGCLQRDTPADYCPGQPPPGPGAGTGSGGPQQTAPPPQPQPSPYPPSPYPQPTPPTAPGPTPPPGPQPTGGAPGQVYPVPGTGGTCPAPSGGMVCYPLDSQGNPVYPPGSTTGGYVPPGGTGPGGISPPSPPSGSGPEGTGLPGCQPPSGPGSQYPGPPPYPTEPGQIPPGETVYPPEYPTGGGPTPPEAPAEPTPPEALPPTGEVAPVAPTEPVPTPPPPLASCPACVSCDQLGALPANVTYLMPWSTSSPDATSVEAECGRRAIEEAAGAIDPVGPYRAALAQPDWEDALFPDAGAYLAPAPVPPGSDYLAPDQSQPEPGLFASGFTG